MKLYNKRLGGYLLIFLFSFILFFLLAYFRSGNIKIGGLQGFSLSSSFGFCILGSTTILFITKLKELKPLFIVLSLWLGISILELPGRIDQASFISLPTYISWCLGLGLGYFIVLIKNGRLRLIFFAMISTIVWVGSSYGYELWFNKYYFDTISGKVNSEKSFGYFFIDDSEDRRISINELSGEYILLDFWHTWCGVCYEKFPGIQRIYDEYINDSNINVYSIHCRFERDGESAIKGKKILAEHSYTIPCFSIKIDDPILKELGVKVYPTVIILNKKRELIFRGSLEMAIKFLQNIDLISS